MTVTMTMHVITSAITIMSRHDMRPRKGTVTGLAPWLKNGPSASGRKVLGEQRRAFLREEP